MENWQFILIAGLLLAALILLVVLLVRQSAFEREMGRGLDLNDLENEMIASVRRWTRPRGPARITERFSGARWERTSGP